ncbi:class I SAM-dependent methyltransferase [Kocuria atrinae]|uniref:Class I SAM-dependent methyltransferase n=1 Tax=Kocuria atrinae TaxID=592377 RepID=A0ABN2XS52_9MICC
MLTPDQSKQFELIPYRFRKSNEYIAAEADAIGFLRNVLPKIRYFPPAGGWGLDYQAIAVLVDFVRNSLEPPTILELGSGISTLWIRAALKEYNPHGRIISMEEDEKFLSEMEAKIEYYSLTNFGSLLHSPLADMTISNTNYNWYDSSVLPHELSINALLIDGPITGGTSRDRYPAVPRLFSRLEPESIVIFDDTNRAIEKEISNEWLRDFEGLSLLFSLHGSTVYIKRG